MQIIETRDFLYVNDNDVITIHDKDDHECFLYIKSGEVIINETGGDVDTQEALQETLNLFLADNYKVMLNGKILKRFDNFDDAVFYSTTVENSQVKPDLISNQV